MNTLLWVCLTLLVTSMSKTSVSLISLMIAQTFMTRFIFLNVEASRVKVLEAKTKKHVTTLIRLIKDGLSGEIGSMVGRFS
jgi:hypothetical protein